MRLPPCFKSWARQEGPKMSRTNPFANLFAIAPGAKKGEDDKPEEHAEDERKKRDDESEEDYAKRMKALDEKEDKEAAEDDKPEEKAETDKDDKDGKKAAARASGV